MSSANSTPGADEEAALLKAIAESLRVSCPFCHKSFKNESDLQFHQIDDCVIGTEGSDDEDDEVFHDTSEEYESIVPLEQFDERSSQAADENPWIIVKNQEAMENVTSQVSLVNENDNVNNITHGTSEVLVNNYELNMWSSLQKKLKTCDSGMYQIQERSGCTVVSFSTASFDVFKNFTIKQLQRSGKYLLKISPHVDQNESVTQEVIRVLDCQNMEHVYTINIYLTKSNAMVNGPKYLRFIEEDFPSISEQIDLMKMSILQNNSFVKKHLMSLQNKQSKLSRKRNTKGKNKIAISPKKYSKCRRRSSRHPSLLTIEEGCSNTEKKPSADVASDSPELLAPTEETCNVVRPVDVGSQPAEPTQENVVDNSAPKRLRRPPPRYSPDQSSPQRVVNCHTIEEQEEKRDDTIPEQQNLSNSETGSLDQVDDRLYCVCKTKYNDKFFYIGCNFCGEWVHGSCVGIDEEAAKYIAAFKCHQCRRDNAIPEDYVDVQLNKVTNLEEDLTKCRSFVDEKTNEVESLKAEIKTFRQQNQSLSRQLKESQNLAEKLDSEVKKLQIKEKNANEKSHEWGRLNDKINNYESHMETLRATNISLNDANENNQKVINQLTLEKDSYKRSAEKLIEAATSENSNLFSEEVDNLRKNDLVDSGTQTSLNIQKVELECKKSKQEFNSLKKKIVELESELTKSANTNDQLLAKVNRLELEHEREVAINNLAMKFNTAAQNVESNHPIGPIAPTRKQKLQSQTKVNGMIQNNIPAVHNSDDTYTPPDTPAERNTTGVQTNHNIVQVTSTSDYTWTPPAVVSKETCYNAFYGEQCHQQCPLNHNLDWRKLNKGICFHEFKEENSCRRKENCWFSHEIPSCLRQDVDFRKYMKRMRNAKLGKKQDTRNTTNNNQYRQQENTNQRK